MATESGADRRDRMASGTLVWIRNPYPEEDTKDGSYRESYLSTEWCGIPAFVPGVLEGVVPGPEERVLAVTSLHPALRIIGDEREFAQRPMSARLVHDLTAVEVINHATVLDQIVRRFGAERIFTSVGPSVLVAVNPRKAVTMALPRSPSRGGGSADAPEVSPAVGVFSPPVMQRYFQREHGGPGADGLPAHLFHLADDMFKAVIRDGVPQAVVLTGEAGSGKTEAGKQLVRFLASVSRAALLARGTKEDARHVEGMPEGVTLEHTLAEALPVIESFSAYAAPNLPSCSRASAVVRMHLRDDGRIADARVDAVMFDASRAANVPRGGRSFHAYHEVLAGLPDATRRSVGLGDAAAEYNLLAAGSEDPSDAITDAQRFHGLVRSLRACGVNQAQQLGVWRIVAAILSLSNVVATPIDRAGTGILNSDWDFEESELEALKRVATCLGIRGGAKTLVTGMFLQGSQVVPVGEANERLKRLAQSLHAALFQWLIQRINEALAGLGPGLRPGGKMRGEIAVYDLPGFQARGRLDSSALATSPASLGDLLANHAAESVEVFVRSQTLHLDARLYEEEGIAAPGPPGVSIPSSSMQQRVITAIESDVAPLGVLAVLREASRSSGFASQSGVSTATTPVMTRRGTVASSIRESTRARGGGGEGKSSGDLKGKWFAPLRNLRRSGVYRGAEAAERRISRTNEASAFVLRHSHAEVLYDAAGFVNEFLACTLPKTAIAPLLDCGITTDAGGDAIRGVARCCRHAVQGLADTVASERGVEAAASVAMLPPAELTRFSPSPCMFDDWLHEAIASAQESDVRVVRCINPISPGRRVMGRTDTLPSIEPEHVVRQLVTAAIAPTAAVRSMGLPNRAPLREFYDRFVILAPEMVRNAGPRLDIAAPRASEADSEMGKARANEARRNACAALVVTLSKHVPHVAALFGFYATSPAQHAAAEARLRRLELAGISMLANHVQVGKSRIFMTDAFLRGLEMARRGSLGAMDTAATTIKRYMRGYHERLRFHRKLDAVVRIQAAVRMHQEKSSFDYHRSYALELKRHVVAFGRRKRYVRMRDAAKKIQIAWRRSSGRAQFGVARRAVLGIHILARGFILREVILNRTKSLIKIQRAARNFLVLNRAYWARERGATKMQALWRGYRTRRSNARVVAFLTAHRMRAAKIHFFRQVFARFKGRLVRSRYVVMRATTRHLQRWIRAQLARKRFWRRWLTAVKVQALVRGHLARRLVGSMRALNDAAMEAWRVHRQRHVETQAIGEHGSVAHALAFWHAGTAAVRSSSDRGVAGAVASTKIGGTMRRIIDVDVIQCAESVYAPVQIEGGGMESEDEGDGSGEHKDGEEEEDSAPSWVQGAAALEAKLLRDGTHSEQVAIGTTHTMVLGGDGMVYSWGWADRGQTGHGTTENRTRPRRLLALSPDAFRTPGVPRSNPEWTPKIRVTAIAAGADHSLAISSAGHAYAWGSNARGQLGLGLTEGGFVTVPAHVAAIRRRISAIAAGAHHSVFLTAAGSVYTAGAAECVGIGRDVTTVMMGERPLPDQAAPVGVSALSRFSIRSIACGWGHTLALSSSGDVFSWGLGRHGQLGLGKRADRHVPALVQPPSELYVRSAADRAIVASAHVKALTVSAGASELGAAEAEAVEAAIDAADPESLAAEQELAQLAVEGRVLMAARRTASNPRFPSSKSPFATGPLTPKDAARVYFAPIHEVDEESEEGDVDARDDGTEPMIRPYCVAQICCGAFHSLAVTRTGALLAWGGNGNGQLGVGDKQDRLWPVTVRGPWNEGGMLSSRKKTHVLRASAGWRSSAVLTSDHKLYQWGHAGALTEDRLRHALGIPLEPSDPESYIEPVEIVRPEPVSLRGCEGYVPEDVELSWGSGLTTMMVRFSVGRESAETVRAVMLQLAQEADDTFGPLVPTGEDAEAAMEEEKEAEARAEAIAAASADPPTPDEEANAVVEMLQTHPELRRVYATVLTERRVRRQVEADARDAAEDEGLRGTEADAYVASMLPGPSENERMIESSIRFYTVRQRREAMLREQIRGSVDRATRGRARSGLALMGRGVAPSPAALAIRWRSLAPMERFRALGLSRAHVEAMTPEQLSRLAFALRAKSHEVARPGLRSMRSPPSKQEFQSTSTLDWFGSTEPLPSRGDSYLDEDDDEEYEDDPETKDRKLRELESGWNPVCLNRKSVRRVPRSSEAAKVPPIALPRFLADEARSAAASAVPTATSSRRGKKKAEGSVVRSSMDPLREDPAADAFHMEVLVRQTGDVTISEVVTPDAARVTLAQLDEDGSSDELTRFQTIAMAIANTAKERMEAARRTIRRTHSKPPPDPTVEEAFDPSGSGRGKLGGKGLGNAGPGLFGQRRDEHRGVLLAGGRYDVAEEQRAAFEAMHKEEAHRRRKEAKSEQSHKEHQAWARSVRGGGGGGGGVLGQFAPEILVATKRALDLGRSDTTVQASLGSSIGRHVVDGREAAMERKARKEAEEGDEEGGEGEGGEEYGGMESTIPTTPPVLQPPPRAPIPFTGYQAFDVATGKTKATRPPGIVVGLGTALPREPAPGTDAARSRFARDILQSALDAAELGDEERQVDAAAASSSSSAAASKGGGAKTTPRHPVADIVLTTAPLPPPPPPPRPRF